MANLVEALRNVRAPSQRLKQEEVWCLLRFDGTDSTIETFWSEKKVTSFINVPIKAAYNTMGPLNNESVPRGFKQTKERVSGLPGRHAEQVLCNNFQRILDDYARTP